MSEPVQVREFNDAIRRLSDQVVEGNETAKDILVEAKRTNGRVYALERGHDVLGTKLADLKQRIDESDPLTKRDLYVGLGVLSVAGSVVAAILTWLPKFITVVK